MSTNFIEITSYEIKDSKSGHKVPVVNGVHIHSIYDPLREGQNILEQYKESLENKSEILFLGLGFGYHVQAIAKYFFERKRPFKMVIIEPNTQIIKDALRFNNIRAKNTIIYGQRPVAQLFQIPELVEFLLERPVVIAHPPSFNLYKDYFTQYLTYKSRQELKHILPAIKDENFREYFKRYDQELTIRDCCIETKAKAKVESSLDFALLAFDKLCNQINITRKEGP